MLRVGRLVALKAQESKIKAEIGDLQGWFERLGIDALQNTKEKTVAWWSAAGRVEVGTSEKVDILSETALKTLLQGVFGDLFKEQPVTYQPTAACKQLLAAIAAGNYLEGSLDDIVARVSADDKTDKTLRKKLCGNFKRDKKALIDVAGLSETDAEEYAYMAAEIVAYTRFRQLLQAAGYTGTFEAARDIVKAAVVVEEGTKVTVEAAK